MSLSTQFSVRVARVDAQAATALWTDAPHSTVFTHPRVLSALCAQVEWWVATVGDEALCVWPLCLAVDGSPSTPGFAYYVGPFWTRPTEPSPRRRLLLEASVYQALLAALRQRCGALRFTLPPGFTDLRAFLWFDHPHEPVLARPRYTACIGDLAAKSTQSLLDGFSTERRADALRAQRRGVHRLPSSSYKSVDALYEQLMADSGASATYVQRRAELRAVWDLIEEGFGYVVACAEAESEALQAAWLVLVAKGRACGVVAAATPAWRARQHNAWTCLQALLDAQQHGVQVYDFNGANSPQRGSDKHSFGAHAELYFDLELRGMTD